MPIDKPTHLNALLSKIDTLCREDLRTLNQYIVERCKELDNVSRAKAMDQFKPGDLVSFSDKKGNQRQAIVLRINKKTVSLSTLAEEERWNVSPEMLTPASPRTDVAEDDISILPIHTNVQPQSTAPDIGKTREWVGGTIIVPGFVTGEPGENYQPTMPVWLNEIGQVIGMEMLSPGDPPFDPVASLKQAIANPMTGPAGAPSHLRVNDETIATKLQEAFPSIQVSVGETDELEELASTIVDDMCASNEPQAYSEIGDDNVAIESFFDSAAALYKCKPWEIVPHDQSLIGVTIDSFGVTDGAISVIGQMNESFGIVLFDSLIEHEQYALMSDAMERGELPNIPPHRSLNFDNANEIHSTLRKDIARHQWTVAHSNAYPCLMAPTVGNMLRALTENDVELFDVIAQALRMALSQPAFVQALRGEGAQVVDYQILTKSRPTIITLHAPYPYERVLKAAGAIDDLISRLLILDRASDGEPDWDEHAALTSSLVKNYETSPERPTNETTFGAASLIMEFAFNYCGCTIATMTPLELEEIVFSIIPRKVMIQPSDAADVIADSRAFLGFLQRAYGLQNASECLKVLDDTAIERLANALDDSSLFGMGKSLFSEQDPFSLFEPPPLAAITPSATKPKPASKKSRKKKRAATRKARKKNR